MPALNEVFAEVRVSGAIGAEHVAKVRRAVYGGGADVEPSTIARLLQIEEAADRADPSWQALLVEAALDHFIHAAEPIETIDNAKAGWLVEHIAADGRIKTGREVELLVRLLEESRSAPDALVALALSQVRLAVSDGDGPLAGIADPEKSRMTRAEVTLVRRILHAFGRDGVPVSRVMAEVLFDVNDAVSGADNDAGWTDLFVTAIANFVTSAANAAPPAKPAEGDDAVEGFNDYAVHRLRGILDSYLTPYPAAEANGAISKSNAQWLAERIGRDGNLDDNENALLRHLRDQTSAVHPALKELIARAA